MDRAARRRLIPLALIVAFGFWLRVRAADHPYISQWDEAYHALVAKNIAARPLVPTLYSEKILPSDDKDWTRSGVWLHKPPLPLWLMASGIAVFGEGELSFRLPAVLLDTLAILLLFLLSEELFGPGRRPAGLIAAAWYALNPLMIRLVSGRIPDDTPHAVNVFFITLTVLLFAVAARRGSRAWAALAGFSLGLGTLCMSAVALLGLAAALPLLAARGPRAAARLFAPSFAAFLAAALPWPLYCLGRWPELWRHESALQVSHLLHSLDGHAHPWWWYAKILPVQYGGAAPFAWALAAGSFVCAAWAGIRKGEAGPLAAACWAAIPYLFFSAIATKLYAYVCVAAPAVCLLMGFAGAWLWDARRGRFRAAALAILIAGGAQAALVAAERVSADYSVCPWNDVYDYPAFRGAMLKLRELPGKKALLNVRDNKAPQAMYYSGAPAYAEAPTAAVARGLIARGYRVFLLMEADRRGEDAPSELKTSEFRGRIFYIPLPPPLFGDPKHPYES